MKICITVETYFPLKNGVAVVTKYLAEGLVKLGNEVTVVTETKQNLPFRDTYNGVEVVRFNLYQKLLKSYGGDINGYIDFVQSQNYDVLINECTACATTDLLIPYLPSLKMVKILHAHGIGMYYAKPFKVMKDFKHTIGNSYVYLQRSLYYQRLKSYLNYYDRFLVLSNAETARKYLDVNGQSRKVVVLGNAIEDIFWIAHDHSSFKKYSELKEKGYFLSVANYSHSKNQIGILEEFYKCQRSDFEMVFIGSVKNEYYNSLNKRNKELAQIHGARKVHVLTDVERGDIPEIINNAYLYLVGSAVEEFSISLAEAMSQGVPFISTNVGNSRFLPGGVVIEKINQMHNTIDSLIGNSFNYRHLAIEGKNYANQNFRIEEKTRELNTLISAVFEKI